MLAQGCRGFYYPLTSPPSRELDALRERLFELRERPVQYLRDAALGKVEGPADLPQGEAIVEVEGGHHALLLPQCLLSGRTAPRYRLRSGRKGIRAMSGAITGVLSKSHLPPTDTPVVSCALAGALS